MQNIVIVQQQQQQQYSEKNENAVSLTPQCRTKVQTYDLPLEEHFYGKALTRDIIGAKEASSEWKYPSLSRNKIPRQNFIKGNKKAIQNGVFNLQSLNQFKNSNVFAQKVSTGQNKLHISIPSADFQYGVKNRPSTPIQYVVGNFYGIQDEINNQQIQEERLQRQTFQKQNRRTNSSLQPIRNTNSSRFYREHNQQYILQRQQSKSPLFKISKFEKTQPRTNTHNPNSKSLMNSLVNPQLIKQSINQKRAQQINQNFN